MHQFRNKKGIERRQKIIKYIIIFVFLLVIASISGFSYFSKFLHYIGWPIWKTEKIISDNVLNNGYVLNSKKYLFEEKNRLQTENEDLKVSMIDYQVLKKENEKLKEILNRLPINKDFILGNILIKPNQTPYDTIVIDIGNDSLVGKGSKVYANGYIPIGEVSEVYEKTSLVTLYTSPGKRTEGVIDGSNASIELVGRGGGNFEMILPNDLPSEFGALIFLPGSSIQILAYVSDIISTPTDPVKKVLLASPVNIQNLKWVEVNRN